MSFHIGAKKGEIAQKVLLPGDPLRAQYIAKKFLSNPVKYNDVRGMYGFTGKYNSKEISVQATGMGLPSTMIYINELINDFNVTDLIRIGTCGAIQDELELKDIVLAQAASTDSSVNKRIFEGLDYSPCADFNLLLDAQKLLELKSLPYHVGNVLSTDTFYPVNETEYPLWKQYNVLAAEMETTALYTLAAKYHKRALTILTVSDIIDTKKSISSEEKEKRLDEMIEVSLEVI